MSSSNGYDRWLVFDRPIPLAQSNAFMVQAIWLVLRARHAVSEWKDDMIFAKSNPERQNSDLEWQETHFENGTFSADQRLMVKTVTSPAKRWADMGRAFLRLR